MPRPAPAVEDYLKAIYAHTEWQPKPMTSSQLAARLGLAPSTVTEMVRKLSGQGLVEHQPYGAVELTAAGRREALRMVRRHRLLETWLVRQFGYGWDEVHDEAEVLEHAVSDRLLDALDEQLGRPTADPHGDPIPTADGEVRLPAAIVLTEVPDGGSGIVARISDRDPAVLQDLERRGIAIGDAVTARQLPPEAEDAVWIEVHERG